MILLPKKTQDRQLGEALRSSGHKGAEERLREIFERAIKKYPTDTDAGCGFVLRELDNEADFYLLRALFFGVRTPVVRERYMRIREEMAAELRMQRAEEAKARQQPQNYGRPNASGGGQGSRASVRGLTPSAVPARTATNETPNASGGGHIPCAPVESRDSDAAAACTDTDDTQDANGGGRRVFAPSGGQEDGAAPVRTDANDEDKFGKWAAERDAKREAAHQANLARVAERQKARNKSLEWLDGVVRRSLLDTIIFDGMPLGDWTPERLAPVLLQRSAHCEFAKRILNHSLMKQDRPIREANIPEDELQRMMVEVEGSVCV